MFVAHPALNAGCMREPAREPELGQPGESYIDFDARHGRQVRARGTREGLFQLVHALRGLREVLRRARSKRIAVRELRSLDDHLLRDIGIETRAGIEEFVYGLDRSGRPRRSPLRAAIASLAESRRRRQAQGAAAPTDKAA